MVSGQAHLGEKLFGAFTSVSKPEDVPSQLVMGAEEGYGQASFWTFLAALQVPSRAASRSPAFVVVR